MIVRASGDVKVLVRDHHELLLIYGLQMCT
jgi:hypothetical protein